MLKARTKATGRVILRPPGPSSSRSGTYNSGKTENFNRKGMPSIIPNTVKQQAIAISSASPFFPTR